MGCDVNDVAKHQLRNKYKMLYPVWSNMGKCDSAYPDVILHNITLQTESIYVCI